MENRKDTLEDKINEALRDKGLDVKEFLNDMIEEGYLSLDIEDK